MLEEIKIERSLLIRLLNTYLNEYNMLSYMLCYVDYLDVSYQYLHGEACYILTFVQRLINHLVFVYDDGFGYYLSHTGSDNGGFFDTMKKLSSDISVASCDLSRIKLLEEH